jgi:hypothetical protein
MKNSNSVSIMAKFSSNKFSSGELLDKGHSLIFRVTTNTLKPFTVHWQVVNTGQAAANEADLRGEITESEIAGTGGLVKDCKEERTMYSGSHWVECFIVKNNQCVARSGEFIVRIK